MLKKTKKKVFDRDFFVKSGKEGFAKAHKLHAKDDFKKWGKMGGRPKKSQNTESGAA